jgi:hypothetical protein
MNASGVVSWGVCLWHTEAPWNQGCCPSSPSLFAYSSRSPRMGTSPRPHSTVFSTKHSSRQCVLPAGLKLARGWHPSRSWVCGRGLTRPPCWLGRDRRFWLLGLFPGQILFTVSSDTSSGFQGPRVSLLLSRRQVRAGVCSHIPGVKEKGMGAQGASVPISFPKEEKPLQCLGPISWTTPYHITCSLRKMSSIPSVAMISGSSW